ncbi:transport Sec61 subunit beta-like [Olea europaea subsp. europaea]|uniref:Transport Sec61 subunit beta-like n=1 Tax=Olea europaea subsp. europaea TaxID=158383 RepID=A0A8S0PDQ1_OLEEU|nr:transport Sec61 subunit beta-like [Olea europaea subsp. europaea]
MAMLPRGSYADMHCRRLGGGSSNSSSSGGASGSNMLRFYKDDAPGLKISPTVVLVRSFIGFVTALHAFGKFYRYKSGHAATSTTACHNHHRQATKPRKKLNKTPQQQRLEGFILGLRFHQDVGVL